MENWKTGKFFIKKNKSEKYENEINLNENLNKKEFWAKMAGIFQSFVVAAYGWKLHGANYMCSLHNSAFVCQTVCTASLSKTVKFFNFFFIFCYAIFAFSAVNFTFLCFIGVQLGNSAGIYRVLKFG